MLKDEAYSKIQWIIERPRIKEGEINQFWRVAFPYLIQRIKMWNGYVLTAGNIAALVIRKQKRNTFATDCQLPTSYNNTLWKTGDSSVYPISRLDCTTCLVCIADSIVTQDILRILSKFPIVIPLIVQDIDEDNKYIVTVPIIQNTVIKWESTQGQIVENYLFTSPFRMVAAIRLGTNKIGKSTILNQLMSQPFLFSSKGEAGGRYGKPYTLNGAVEIVWLTQETCSKETWRASVADCYRENTKEVKILANFHGSAIHNTEILQYLEKHVLSFIVFLMPGYSEQEWTQLKHCIKNKHVSVLVDPQETIDDKIDMNTIRTESLSSDDTLDTMRCILQRSFNFNTTDHPASIEDNDHSYKSLRYAEPLHCKESTEIVAIVRKHGCLNIKQLLNGADIKEIVKWDSTLNRLITLSLDILSLPTRNAKKQIAHLEINLSQISAKESIAARAEVSEAKEKLRRILKVLHKPASSGSAKNSQMEEDLKFIKQELDTAMNKFDNINLGQEHIFRTLGHIYENSWGVANLGAYTGVGNLPGHVADLLINGHAIELLNGDTGDIQLFWIKAICKEVLKKLPYLKVFVISIIGLQSSGKSTLLNALFSCRFAVSVGRSSRGLFMRMIFLDETLRSSQGYDAIILIDTEGLSSPEKMNDPKATQKDRLMATFAMGISNLTIVNILGEGMTEMIEILQIAIVTMARMRVGGIKPDILVVHHLQERDLSKIDQDKRQFCEAINKAFELISKNDVEIGSASSECLAELLARIHSGDLFQHFGPFKDGSCVNSPPSESYHDNVVILLETILKRTEVSGNKTSFDRWCIHFESYWTGVQEENFALNFKNVMHIADFLYFKRKLAKVKELLDRAIRCHREIFSKNIREEVSSQISKRRTADLMKHQQKLLGCAEQQLKIIPHSCPRNCDDCQQFKDNHAALLDELSNSEWKEESVRSLETYNTRLYDISMKMLRQTFDGSLIRQGCFSEFSKEISTQLQTALLKRPSGIYSQEEQTEIRENIWKYLQDVAASMGGGSNLETMLNQTLSQEYSGECPTVLKDFENEITIDHLADSIAIKSLWDSNSEVFLHLNCKLSEAQLNNLMSTINQLIDAVFDSRCADFRKTGMNFEEGMIVDIKAAFPDAIKKFEDRLRLKLEGTFKMNLQAYALQHFRRRMIDLQRRWDSQNDPKEILKQKEQDYITEIETRLMSGFSSAGEGKLFGTKLYDAMKKRAIRAGYEKKIQLIKDMSWTRNSETVRLCYFEELAQEILVDKKHRALRHFQNPTDEIEKWYKQRVDSNDANGEVMATYDSLLKFELRGLKEKISNSTKESEINKIVAEYIKTDDDRYYSILPKTNCDFSAFRASMERTLQSLYEADDRNNVVFPLASDDSVIMGRLGCTENCSWCGALCWATRDHQSGKDKSSEEYKHTPSHQPSGFKGVKVSDTNKLNSCACHKHRDNWRVFFRDHVDGKGILWSEAKQHHFGDWSFLDHDNKKFDVLMRWFFQGLHQYIAKSRGSLPADEDDLRKNKCQNLNYHDILKNLSANVQM